MKDAIHILVVEDETAIREGFVRVLNREPNPVELKENRAFLEEQVASYGEGDANASRQQALADFCQVLFSLKKIDYLQ